jgi:hypothetical protein
MTMENVTWIVPPDNPESMSSYRYNAFIPAKELGGQVLSFDSGDPEAFLNGRDLDAVVICKPIILTIEASLCHPLVNLAEACKKKNIPVCFHICDWHFDIPVYKRLAELSDLIVVQTHYIAREVERYFETTPAIIEEPYEGPRGRVRFKPKKKLKLVWFGNASNLDTLTVGLQQLHQLDHLFKLSIITNDMGRARETFDAVAKPPDLIERAIIPFTLERQWQEIELADVVIIPGFYAKEKNVKGHNRLIQSLHSGRLAVVFPLPQYIELSDYCLCNEDIAEGIKWSLQNKMDVFQKIKAGQKYIDQRFSPAAVAARWKDELSKLIK